PARGSPGDPLTWVVQDQRNLGVLFPLELQQGVTLQRPPLQITASLPAGNEAYRFQVLQDKRYTFLVSSVSLPPGMRLTITDVSGNPEPARTFKTLQVITVRAVLKTGSYIIHVSGWSATAGFSIKIIIDSALEPAPPLTVGPGPAVPLRSLTDVPPP